MTETAKHIETVAAELGLSMKANFVPLSRSRNAKQKHPTLNWAISLIKNGNVILETDYTAGCAHCPSYKQNDKSLYRDEAVKLECEHGFRAQLGPNGPFITKGTQLHPTFADVIYSLTTDADVIDYPTYEEWASDVGYDADSRKGESIYRASLAIALKLRSAIGANGIEKLREACQDY